MRSPHSRQSPGGPPSSTGGMARSPLRWPPCWHPSGTWVPSPSAAPEPPPRRPGPAPPRAGCSWSRGGTTRRRAPGAIGWVSPTAAPSGASPWATGPSPRPRTRMRPPMRCWPPSRGCTPCGMRCCPPRGCPSRPRSTSTPTRGTTPTRGRGSRPAHSWGRGGSAAGCRSLFTRPDPGVLAPGGRPLRLPWPSPLPPLPPPCPAPPPPPPRPTHGTATGLPPPSPRERPGAHSMHGRPICRVVRKAIERPPGGL